MQNKLRVALIGLGKQGSKYLAPVTTNPDLQLAAVCESNPQRAAEVAQQYNCPGYTTVNQLLQEQKIDFAIVALPHHAYFPVIKELAEHKVHILKEKPFAVSEKEGIELDKLIQQHEINMMISVQRRFDLNYQMIFFALQQIGQLRKVEAKYNFANKDRSGWRYDAEHQAGAGVVLDMGYHFIDLILWYFGMPENFTSLSSGSGVNEDSAHLLFTYQDPQQKSARFLVNLAISRVHNKKQEKLQIIGSQGAISIDAHKGAIVTDGSGKIIAAIPLTDSATALFLQVNHFKEFLCGQTPVLLNNYREHFKHLELIQALNLSTPRNSPTLFKSAVTDFTWPLLTAKTEQALLKQARTSLSIYDRSGIIAEFEDKFAKYHGRKYVLLSNSGTSAIYAMYSGINLQAEDEILAPVYTFPATVSPICSLSGKIVFCDCNATDGNISPAAIRQKITPRSKALIITHMWGIPCDMDEIRAICAEHNLRLLEDCSHAHGARYKDKVVGSFGDGAAWSFQSMKVIPSGQGGGSATDDTNLHRHALASNQFNQRCKQEIPKTHPLYELTSTGMGLNHTIHPLAAAIANEQFDNLEDVLYYKRLYAAQMIKAWKDIPFLKMPEFKDKSPSWYAFVMQFIPENTSWSIEDFHQKLIAAGLKQADRPQSTRPLNDLALFRPFVDPQERFPAAEKFYKCALKLPVFTQASDAHLVKWYIDTLNQVAAEMLANPKPGSGTRHLSRL